MEHLTDFELVLVGASIATIFFGINTFIKEIYLPMFHRKHKVA